MAKELAKSYKPSEFEDKIYDFWMEGNYFHAEADKDKKTEKKIAEQKKLDDALEKEISQAIEEFKETVDYKMA